MDTPAQPPSKSPRRFFDIVPSNKTVPNASSRPILVSNQPEQADPMLNKSEPPATPSVKPSQPAPDNLPSLADEPPTPKEEPAQKPPEPAEPPTPDTPPATTGNEVDIHDMPLELPANTPKEVTVVKHSYSGKTARNAMTIFLIIIVLAIIADLLLDIGFVKLALPHTHFFGS